MNGMMRTGALALLLAGTQLAGCGGGQAPVQAPRPVWVVQAVPGQGGTALGFPGDVHARQESPLSFRVGGKLVRRLVEQHESQGRRIFSAGSTGNVAQGRFYHPPLALPGR